MSKPSGPRPNPGPLPPRALAAGLVAGVLTEGRMLTEAGVPDQTPPATRAQALRLAQAVLRNLARTDAVLAPYLRKPPPDAVLALLRVGVVDGLDQGAPAHGVVNDIVGYLRAQPKGAPVAGMANAVLRRALETEGWAKMPIQRLPGWLRRRLRGAYGEEAVQAFEAAHHAGAPLDLSLRAGRSAPPGAVELPGGSWRLTGAGQVSALPGFDSGDWWVQDAAAALPAQVLAVQPGETVLDLCAAPGGKTMQLADAGATVTALDVSDARLNRLRQNLARTGLSARVICADALDWNPDAPFDAILLDAPCSATGTIRRHPDLPFVRKPADLESLVALQTQMLDRALGMLRPGGRLVYCTCSLLPDEGEAQIGAALVRHPDLRAEPIDLPLGRASGDGWRTRPDDLPGGLDGFFIAALRKTAD